MTFDSGIPEFVRMYIAARYPDAREVRLCLDRDGVKVKVGDMGPKDWFFITAEEMMNLLTRRKE
jgi:hypothetical protein